MIRFYRDLSIAKKIVIMMTVLVVLALTTTALKNYRDIGKTVEFMLGKRLEHIARTAALQIPLELHHRVLQAYLDQEAGIDALPEFKKIQETLQKIQAANNLVSDVYTLVRPDWAPETMVFVTMSNPKPYVGNGMALNKDAQATFEEGAPHHTDLYEDSEGVWVSAFAPLKDSSGKVEAILEIDYNAKQEVAEAKRELFMTISYSVIGGIVLSLLLGLWLGGAFSKPIIRLAAVAGQVAKGDLTVQVTGNFGHDEIGALSKTFNNMIVDLKKSRDALEDYAKNLEQKVAERTAQLKASNDSISAMVNSLGQGFLLFDQGGVCQPVYSKACEALLETQPANKPISEVLAIPLDQRAKFESWAQKLFLEPLPFEDIAPLGKKLFPHSAGRYVTLEYKPVRDESGVMSQVVVIATDKTEEQEAKNAAEQERIFAAMVLKIVKDKEQFIEFIHYAKGLIERLRQEAELRPAGIDAAVVMRLLHTLKGGAGSFAMKSLMDAAHDLETQLALVDRNDKVAFAARVKEAAQVVNAKMEHFIEETKDVFGEALHKKEKMLEIPFSSSLHFLEKLKGSQVPSALREEFINQFVAEPIQRFFEPFNATVKSVAENQLKEIKPIGFRGGDLRVISIHYKNLFAALVHAFRNAVDHGVEWGEERSAVGKDPAGLITVSFSSETRDREGLSIIIEDDGRGIDPQAIRGKLKKSGLAEAAERESDEEVIQHIFDKGFSTAQTVTDISGRGVGMDAIKDAVEELKGSVCVKSSLGRGTRLIVWVPKIEAVAV